MATLLGRWSWSDDGWIVWSGTGAKFTENTATTPTRIPAAARYKSRYVDPDTGGWVLADDHNDERINSVLGWVYGMLMTERGSIPELPWFGSRLRSIKHITPGVCAQIEGAIDEALRPFVGRKFDSYTRKAWKQNGAPLFSVTVKVAGTTGVAQIPME